MNAAIAEFEAIARKPYEWAAQWKNANGRKVVACLPMYVPEEVLHAAGLLPVVLQGRDEELAPAHDHVHPFLCHPMRANLDAALRGEIAFADGLVIPDICDQSKRIGSLWRLKSEQSFVHFVSFPKVLDALGSREFLVAELASFRRAVEGFAGADISDGALRASIRLYNRTRALLGELWNLRSERPGAVPDAEMAAVAVAAMTMSKDDFNPLLSSYLEAKRDERAPATGPVRLMLTAQPCEDVESGFLDLLNELGATTVGDDMFPGSKYLKGAVREDGDPIAALADAYLGGVGCPTKYHPPTSYFDEVVSEVRRTRAEGVVALLPKYCEIYGFALPALSTRLAAEGIPLLALENDHSGVEGPVKTRLQAFLEMLRED